MGTPATVDRVVMQLRGCTLTHEQGDRIREAVAICTMAQPPRDDARDEPHAARLARFHARTTLDPTAMELEVLTAVLGRPPAG